MNRSRRAILVGALGALIAPPLVRSQSRLYRIAWIAKNPSSGTTYPPRPYLDLFKERLGELGFVDGKNLEIRVFTPESSSSVHIAAAARRAVEWKPDLIKVRNSIDTRITQTVTSTVPIVFSRVGDPVAAGIIESIKRPGGNATGVDIAYEELALKRLELAREIAPAVRRIGIIFNGNASPGNAKALSDVRGAALRMAVVLEEVDTAAGEGHLQGALDHLSKSRPNAVLPIGWIGDARYAEKLAEFQARARIPVIDDEEPSVERGVIAALCEDPRDHFRRAADIAAKVLKGEKPEGIPVDTTARFRLAVNARAAKALGIVLPPSMILRADRVID